MELSGNILFHPKALAEFTESFNWYEEQKNGLGADFELEIERTLNKILLHPEQYGLSKSGFSQAIVDVYPFTIVYNYTARSGMIYVASIHHTRRDPKRKFRSLED